MSHFRLKTQVLDTQIDLIPVAPQPKAEGLLPMAGLGTGGMTAPFDVFPDLLPSTEQRRPQERNIG